MSRGNLHPEHGRVIQASELGALKDQTLNIRLGAVVASYCESVRPHTHTEKRGIVQQLRRLLAKGVTLDMIDTALRNYVSDPFIANSDPRFRKNIRSCFAEANVRLWQKPMPRRGRPTRDPQLDVLDRLDALC